MFRVRLTGVGGPAGLGNFTSYVAIDSSTLKYDLQISHYRSPNVRRIEKKEREEREEREKLTFLKREHGC